MSLLDIILIVFFLFNISFLTVIGHKNNNYFQLIGICQNFNIGACLVKRRTQNETCSEKKKKERDNKNS